MKIPLAQFKEAIDAVLPFAQVRSPLEILTHVKLDSTGSKLICTASSIDSQIQHSIDCDGELFSVTIEASALKKFSQFCEEDITLTIKNGKADLKSGSAKVRLGTLKGEDFPMVQKSEEIITELDWLILRDKIAFTGLFAATADIRPVMNCVQIKSTGTSIDVVGTNGMRLAIESVANIAPTFAICIPIEGARRMTGDYKSFVVREGQIELRGPQSIAVFKLSQSKPIDGKRVVAPVLPNEGRIARKSLIDAISFSTAFHDGKLRSIVKIESGEKNTVQLTGLVNEADTSFDYEGTPFLMSVFSSDMSDALKALNSEKIKFEFDANDMQSKQIRLIDGPRTICVMPTKG